ncbi:MULTISPECIES: FtsX-like permease family protein [unclassified Sphingomonas]|uniref:cell division protein FtsX n=1 Tax=unclassified Sphingomonas TaxID=196159 RepID=UPI001F5A584D|nr:MULTISPECIES: FtsX-like permease family protein [unclassified Sphingomonas]
MSGGLIASKADRRLLDDRRGTRVMLWVMAIMLFLTVLAAALGLATLGAAALLDRQLAGRLTVQIVAPAEGVRTREAAAALVALRRLPEVRRAAPVDRARLAEMLRPWLGADGADPDLPIPAMIDVDLSSGRAATVQRVTAAVRTAAPSARIDRQESWMAPVRTVMAMLTGLAGGLVVLMAGATAAVVILAARAGLDTHGDTIAVLHMLGSTDVQVARLFQRRIGVDTLIGGLLGMAVAVGVVALIGAQLNALESDLVAGLTLGTRDWAILACLPLAFAVLATLSARLSVLAALRRVL